MIVGGMNIFVLNAGRCGSSSFIRACSHIHNFTVGHESRVHLIGPARLAYPQNHIEADNRLSWLLGRLQQQYGDQARYLHLRRQRAASIASFVRRRDFGIMQAYREGILLGGSPGQSDEQLAADYLDTVEANIQLFLQDKTQQMEFQLEHAEEDFARFWDWIGAEGKLDDALAEWQVRHNASDPGLI
jgi:hypothetical protein